MGDNRLTASTQFLKHTTRGRGMLCYVRQSLRSTTIMRCRYAGGSHPAHLQNQREKSIPSDGRHRTIRACLPDSGHAGMTARRLATILAVVGYSRLVSADEADERPALMSGIDPGRVKTFFLPQKLHAAGRNPRRRDRLSLFLLYRVRSQSGRNLAPRRTT